VKHNHPVTILTKSSLVLRDINLLKRVKDCTVGLTITILRDNIKQCFEPVSSTIEERLNALHILHDKGLQTYAFLTPLLPFFVEESLEGLARKFRAVEVNEVWSIGYT